MGKIDGTRDRGSRSSSARTANQIINGAILLATSERIEEYTAEMAKEVHEDQAERFGHRSSSSGHEDREDKPTAPSSFFRQVQAEMIRKAVADASQLAQPGPYAVKSEPPEKFYQTPTETFNFVAKTPEGLKDFTLTPATAPAVFQPPKTKGQMSFAEASDRHDPNRRFETTPLESLTGGGFNALAKQKPFAGQPMVPIGAVPIKNTDKLTGVVPTTGPILELNLN